MSTDCNVSVKLTLWWDATVRASTLRSIAVNFCSIEALPMILLKTLLIGETDKEVEISVIFFSAFISDRMRAAFASSVEGGCGTPPPLTFTLASFSTSRSCHSFSLASLSHSTTPSLLITVFIGRLTRPGSFIRISRASSRNPDPDTDFFARLSVSICPTDSLTFFSRASSISSLASSKSSNALSIRFSLPRSINCSSCTADRLLFAAVKKPCGMVKGRPDKRAARLAAFNTRRLPFIAGPHVFTQSDGFFSS
mmetsp:Transcript_41816/g.82253  ORF Transcript_41816/g.82253 Transcript_41816/m.82253 type:complete len:253 (+) Transcript_41816:368-1126(+)